MAQSSFDVDMDDTENQTHNKGKGGIINKAQQNTSSRRPRRRRPQALASDDADIDVGVDAEILVQKRHANS